MSAVADRLAPCRIWSNCVCSRPDAVRRHRIAPFAVPNDPAATFERLKSLLEELERTEIVTATHDYIHAICRSRRGFIDDVECRLSPEESVIHIRSASRSGTHDLGVNRRRMEALRQRLESA